LSQPPFAQCGRWAQHRLSAKHVITFNLGGSLLTPTPQMGKVRLRQVRPLRGRGQVSAKSKPPTPGTTLCFFFGQSVSSSQNMNLLEVHSAILSRKQARDVPTEQLSVTRDWVW
jgi:hypothetical protein